MNKKKWILVGCTSLIFGLIFAVKWLSHTIADMLIYNGRTQAEWQHESPASCSDWISNVAYAISPSPGHSASASIVPTCAEIVKFSVEHHRIKNSLGSVIHYVMMNTTSVPDAPFWVHFHGINGNYLHGARYYEAAKRLGFELVAAEFVNHGTSGYDGKGAAYGCKEHFDVSAVIGDLLNRYPDRNILISASSMGTMALALADKDLSILDRNHRVIAYALENPISSLRNIIAATPTGQYIPAFLLNLGLESAAVKSGYDFDECAPIHAYKRFSRPTLVQHSEKDEFVPIEMGQTVYDSLPKDLAKNFKRYPMGMHSAIWNSQMLEFENDIAEIWRLGLKIGDQQRK